jgi:drug/metabolite transporter (DMT)-like permease
VFYEVSKLGLGWLVMVALAVELVIALALPDDVQDRFSIVPLLMHMPQEHMVEMLGLVLVNGTTYAIYNQMSFVVLSMVTVVTHAVANSMRRVVTIIVSVWYFQNPVSLQNGLGMSLAIFGVCVYSLCKSYDEARAKGRGK